MKVGKIECPRCNAHEDMEILKDSKDSEDVIIYFCPHCQIECVESSDYPGHLVKVADQ